MKNINIILCTVVLMFGLFACTSDINEDNLNNASKNEFKVRDGRLVFNSKEEFASLYKDI